MPARPERIRIGVPPEEYSSWLREGLATTLLHVAVLSGQAQLTVTNQSPQQFVDQIVKGLPGLSTDYRLLTSLRDELSLLAEAAPGPLLAALEQMLEGDATVIKPIFSEIETFMSPSSYHTGVLWALELLAWEREFLNRVALILAKLTRIDPGGRLSNRPLNSLRSIFLTW